jgi:type I restriction enzyme, R subunit
MSGPTEADTCRKFVVPKLQAAGWDDDPHSIAEQRTFTDGRIIVAGSMTHHGKKKRADYLLRYTRDFPIAVVEAKAEYKTPGAGLQQAKEYAEILGLNFAYATNGTSIVEFDFTTGLERELDAFPTPTELWDRLAASENIPDHAAEQLLTPYFNDPLRTPRYYQQIAINRTVQNILQGNPVPRVRGPVAKGRRRAASQPVHETRRLASGLLDRRGDRPLGPVGCAGFSE